MSYKLDGQVLASAMAIRELHRADITKTQFGLRAAQYVRAIAGTNFPPEALERRREVSRWTVSAVQRARAQRRKNH